MVIIDELTARKVVIMMGLPIMGAVGLLIQAKRTGLIKEVKPLLDEMIRPRESVIKKISTGKS